MAEVIKASVHFNYGLFGSSLGCDLRFNLHWVHSDLMLCSLRLAVAGAVWVFFCPLLQLGFSAPIHS